MSNLDKDYLHDLFIEEASAIRVKHRKVETAYQEGYENGYAEGVEQGGGAEPELQAKTVIPIETDELVRPDKNYDGLSSVLVKGVELAPCIMYPGTETVVRYARDEADGRYVGYNEVTIFGEPNLIPENIADGVKIFDVTGTLKAGGDTSELEQQIEELEATVTELETWKTDNSFAAEVFEGKKASGYISYLFSGCSALTTVPLFDTSNATSMANMFTDCRALTTVPLFDTSNITSMAAMFNNCKSLTTVPLFDTSNVTTMASMFSGCYALTTVPLFNTSKVTSMSIMFMDCRVLTTVPLFITSKVTSMSNMFTDCDELTTVPLFDTSNVTTMASMFSGCSALTTVPLFNTSKVTNMSNMLTNCTSLTAVPQFDTSKVTNMTNMFTNCKSLTDCYLRNIATNLQVGSGSTYGRLLTIDSLLHLIKELRDTGSLKTLTMGNVNLEKIANTYVKLVPITDEMRAEDDLIDEKYPFEVCESTDEGAMTINNYVASKNWQLK